MQIRAYTHTDFDSLVALWTDCDLVRPWNDPQHDVALCLRSPSSALFVGMHAIDETLCASVMTGSDGHRGWMYYLAVAPGFRARGYAREMVRHAEAWLGAQGVPKVDLMIRDDNTSVRAFYECVGYAVEARIVMSRWLRDDAC